jgi:uncharacterized membrane protein
MQVIFLSLAAAFFFGFDPFFVKKGLVENPNPIAATIISLTVNVSFFLTLSLITSQFIFIGSGILYFILAGLFAPGMARIFSYKGIDKLGASVSTPLQSTETLFSFILAVIFLEEKITLPIVFGTGSICLGVMILKREIESQRNMTNRWMRDKRYLFFPIIAAVLYGTSVFLRKLGLNEVRSPILGAMMTSLSSWVLLTLFLSRKTIRRDFINLNRKATSFFLISGGCTSLAWLSLFYALSIGKVVVVSPVQTSHPLFTVLLSYLFLRNVERVTYKTFIGALLIITGISLLSMGN